ncbi:hypothetical protein FKM82_021051 [Ascaphus truei]
MAGGGGGIPCVLLLGSILGLSAGLRLICWQAALQCQDEPDCSYAYSQYTEACAPVLRQQGGQLAASHSAARRRCPSHCISALIQLNHTKRGPALEDCDCAMDETCKATKRAIEPCMPRTSGGGGGGGGDGAAGGGGSSVVGGAVMGCTEARRRCEDDRLCNSSLKRYLLYCGRLFNGVRCTDDCKGVIQDMLAVPQALLLNDCVCDGSDRPICESIKENMARLCFGAEAWGGGPGSSGGADYDYDEEDEDDPEEQQQLHRARPPPQQPDSQGAPRAAAAWTVLAAFVLQLLLL